MRWSVDDPTQVKTLAAHYLLHAKSRGGLPSDPVARFHLGNGAIVQAVHADADTSDKGRAQSGGATVNYLYDLARVEANHDAYVISREVMAAKDVRALADAADLTPTQES